MRVRYKREGLQKLIAQLGGDAGSRVQVGVFANKSTRKKDSRTIRTNAEIGYAHEFGAGSRNQMLPMRSFLRMPLFQHLRDDIRINWAKTIKERGMTAALKKLGVVCEGVIQKAFATGGFGQWTPLSPVTIRRKRSSAILIETSQLRRSISSRVV